MRQELSVRLDGANEQVWIAAEEREGEKTVWITVGEQGASGGVDADDLRDAIEFVLGSYVSSR